MDLANRLGRIGELTAGTRLSLYSGNDDCVRTAVMDIVAAADEAPQQREPESVVAAHDRLLERNREGFERLLGRAERYVIRGRYDPGAAWAEMAADQAATCHPGFFADDRLETLVARIGTMTAKPARWRSAAGTDWPRRVLHVLTAAYTTGGHTRFAWRWIEADRSRRHCVVLTRHWPAGPPLPQPLVAASESTGGWARTLDWRRDLSVARATQLRALATEFDLVVLHTHPFDPVPSMAFATDGPPVVLLNHAGSMFWMGRAVADVVACLRPSTRNLAVTRRGIAADRSPALPIPVSPLEPNVSRSQARDRLGLRTDAVVLFTVATRFKYVPFEPGCSFLDLVTSLALANQKIEVLAIGPDDSGMWRKARDQTGGRVRALGRHPEVGLHERAADVYLDSYPVTSPTSFLEAGSCNLPIVSFCPHRDRAAALCADDFTVDDLLLRTRTPELFAVEVQRLIEDASAREALGRATAEAIMTTHGSAAFATRLEEVYSRAAAAHAAGRSAACGTGSAGPYDRCLARMLEATATSSPLWSVIARHRDTLPYLPRQWWRVKARLASCLTRRRSDAVPPSRSSAQVA